MSEEAWSNSNSEQKITQQAYENMSALFFDLYEIELQCDRMYKDATMTFKFKPLDGEKVFINMEGKIENSPCHDITRFIFKQGQ